MHELGGFPVRISYLADHQDAVGALAEHLLEHWRQITLELTLDDRLRRLRSHLNKDSLPLALLAHADGIPMGTAALRKQDLAGWDDLSPWLGGVFVLPEYRSSGIGAALCGAVEGEARRLGYHEIYLFTLDQRAWYTKQGWATVRSADWRGHPGTIMRKELL